MTFLGTGVALIILTAIFLVIMPIVALVCFSLVFASLFERKKVCSTMSTALDHKKVFVFFPTRSDNFEKSNFFKGNCLDLASKKNCAVLIVSPYHISKKGIAEGKFFFSLREESKNIYTVRRYVFFYLRKRILDGSDQETVYFY